MSFIPSPDVEVSATNDHEKTALKSNSSWSVIFLCNCPVPVYYIATGHAPGKVQLHKRMGYRGVVKGGGGLWGLKSPGV